MPLWHCTKCHHEWEGSDEETICDWCGALGYVLEEATPLEKMIKEYIRNPDKFWEDLEKAFNKK